jgi:beta-galactosidase
VNGQKLGSGKQSDKYLFTFPDVAWEAGEIKAVALRDGKPVAIDSKHTVGPAVALKAAQITGPGGLQADGSDVALVDIEAVDAKGERSPTFERRVDFKLSGPGIWRGGYNSGKEKSTNNAYLDLECGINRVAVRSTEAAGAMVVTATCEGLQPATISILSHPMRINSGISPAIPMLPLVALLKVRASATSRSSDASSNSVTKTSPTHGKFLKDFSYSGPSKNVHIEADASAGKKIYVDSDEMFGELPSVLRGADWIQAAIADRLYNAVDLMEIPAPSGSIVFIAHDDRLDRPAWLTKQFHPTEMSLKVNGKPMKLFEHHAAKDESLTLGTNTENEKAGQCNMYIVFVIPEPTISSKR